MAKKKRKAKKAMPSGNVGQRPQNLVIGLTGPVGSGCTEMAATLEKEEGFERYKMSDAIREELEAKGETIEKGTHDWRKKLQDHGNMRRQENLCYWMERLHEKVNAASLNQDTPVVIDGIRNHGEVRALRASWPNFFLVAMCADKEHRWQRVKDDYGGDQEEFERDDRRDQNEGPEWGQSVQRCVDEADYVCFNNEQHLITTRDRGGGKQSDTRKIGKDLKGRTEDFLPLMNKDPEARAARPEEIQIAAAYALSHASGCLKRHVGAVITIDHDGLELPISTGYNENPASVIPCVETGDCFKDECMRSLFEALQVVFCPSCGERIESPTDETRCGKCGQRIRDWLYPTRGMELCTAIHAEERAIRSLGDRSAKGGKLYVTTFPCFQCARMILDADISEVHYVEAYPNPESRKLLEDNGCHVVPFSGFTARAFFRVFERVA